MLAPDPSRALKRLRLAAVLALSWATCKRLKNIAKLSLAGLAVACMEHPMNPSGAMIAVNLGLEKAQLLAAKKAMSDAVRYF